MKEPTAEELYLYIDKFKDIYEYGQLIAEPQPDDVVTYYCDNDSGEKGFVYNTKWKDGGFEKFIAKKWILQSDLDLLISANNELKEYYNSDEVQDWMNAPMGTPKLNFTICPLCGEGYKPNVDPHICKYEKISSANFMQVIIPKYNITIGVRDNRVCAIHFDDIYKHEVIESDEDRINILKEYLQQAILMLENKS